MRVGLAFGAVLVVGCAPPAELDGPEPVGEAVAAATVAEAAGAGCSTSSVKGLSEQIVAQSNCIEPGAFVKVPELANVSFGGSVFPYLEEPAKEAFVATLKAKPGTSMGINSMLRTVAQQWLLYRWDQLGTCGIAIAAAPGNSNHETGLAFDTSDYSVWRTALENHGFSWYGSGDAVHYDFTGPGAVDHRGVDVLAFQQLWNLNHPGDLIDADGLWGPQTEAKLKVSPADGFAKGADCSVGKEADIHPAVALVDGEDLFDDGASAEVLDVFDGELREVRLDVVNQGQAATSNVEIGVEVDAPFLEVVDWRIDTDWMHAGTFEAADADSSPKNPSHDEPATDALGLHLLALSAGETKRVTLTLRTSYSIGAGALAAGGTPAVRFWVRDVPELYHQDEFDGDAENVDGSQSFGARLQASLAVDVYAHTRWEWNSDRREGWTPGAGSTAALDGGSLVLEGEQGVAATAPETSFAAAERGTVSLRGRTIGGAGTARLFFVTEEEPEESEARALALTLPVGAVAELQLDAAAHPAWRGTVTGLRLEADAPHLELDWLRVGPLDAPGQPEADDDVGSNALAEGCVCGTPGRPGRGPGAPLVTLALLGWWVARKRRAPRAPRQGDGALRLPG
jgi:hypothetical protein